MPYPPIIIKAFSKWIKVTAFNLCSVITKFDHSLMVINCNILRLVDMDIYNTFNALYNILHMQWDVINENIVTLLCMTLISDSIDLLVKFCNVIKENRISQQHSSRSHTA